MIRLTNYIMGVPVDAQSPLDEIALSTLKEVASQCVGAAMDELNDFLGRDMRDTITRISAFDNTERIQDIIRSWNAEDSVLLMGLHYVIDGVVESDAYIVASQALKQVLGISDMADMSCQETGGQTPGMPAAGMQAAEHKEAIAVQEVSFPEFKYTPIVYAKEQIGEEKKKLLDITPVSYTHLLSELEPGENSFSLTLDGVNRTITFTKGATEQDTINNINQVLYRNFGTSVGMDLVKVGEDDSGNDINVVKLVKLNEERKSAGEPVDSSRRVIIESAGNNDTISKLGFSGGFSNKLDYGTSLKDMNFATPLEGNRYEFQINGVTIKGLTRCV